jgi:hypothetical protein
VFNVALRTPLTSARRKAIPRPIPMDAAPVIIAIRVVINLTSIQQNVAVDWKVQRQRTYVSRNARCYQIIIDGKGITRKRRTRTRTSLELIHMTADREGPITRQGFLVIFA